MANVTAYLNVLRQYKVGLSGRVTNSFCTPNAGRNVLEVGASEEQQQLVMRAKLSKNPLQRLLGKSVKF